MSGDLSNPIFHDADKAREWLEARIWPNGPICPHCGTIDMATLMQGKTTRPGLYQCNSCREPFTVTVGTLYERSHVPLTKWLLASYLLSSSKKGMSSLQLSRMLGVTYKTAWFMTHRIREAMIDPSAPPIGGGNKVVEIDETYVGGKAKNRKGKVPKKTAVLALVERDGQVRAQKVSKVTSKTLRPIIAKHAAKTSYIMTDESPIYPKIGDEFAGHGTVNHSKEEYARGNFWHTNTVENFFSIMKRGITGVYHHCGEQHLDRYVGEFGFRYNTRNVTDMERATLAAKGIEGKRLTYRRLYS